MATFIHHSNLYWDFQNEKTNSQSITHRWKYPLLLYFTHLGLSKKTTYIITHGTIMWICIFQNPIAKSGLQNRLQCYNILLKKIPINSKIYSWLELLFYQMRGGVMLTLCQTDIGKFGKSVDPEHFSFSFRISTSILFLSNNLHLFRISFAKLCEAA